MGHKTEIDWCDSSWNPVTGCRHRCEYCYAQRIARRFCGKGSFDPESLTVTNGIFELERPALKADRKTIAPYPFGFDPTFHRYRLDEPQHWRKPRNIFVCSMADLFGKWVPEEWIRDVFEACKAAPQHRYLFLTKNPARYLELAKSGVLPTGDNFWYGTTVTRANAQYFYSERHNCFLSIEPIMEDFGRGTIDDSIGWVIIGAETGNRQDKVWPGKEWIENIARICRRARRDEGGIPVFMKASLRELMEDDFVQQYPWEVTGNV